MEEQIHQSQTTRALNKFLPEVRFGLEALVQFTIKSTLRLLNQPLIRGNKESTRAASWITNRKSLVRPRIRLHATNDGFDQKSRGKVLPCAFLPSLPPSPTAPRMRLP